MKTLLLPFFCLIAAAIGAPEEIVLWPNGAPGSEGQTSPEVVATSPNGERQVTSIHRPSITVFLPAKEKANGVGVLVIPGGGHRLLCVDHEGAYIAQWLAERGLAAFVLKHRLAREAGSTYSIEGHALPDTQRALRLIRSRSAEWNIDPARLGAMGFSAGGELVSLACLRPSAGQPDAVDPIDRLDARPVFQALIYPGRSADIIPVKDTPQAFLACSANDRTDISEGLAEVYLRFKRAGASAELHIYASGGHGFGWRTTNRGAIGGWSSRFLEWLQSRSVIPAQK